MLTQYVFAADFIRLVKEEMVDLDEEGGHVSKFVRAASPPNLDSFSLSSSHQVNAQSDGQHFPVKILVSRSSNSTTR